MDDPCIAALFRVMQFFSSNVNVFLTGALMHRQQKRSSHERGTLKTNLSSSIIEIINV